MIGAADDWQPIDTAPSGKWVLVRARLENRPEFGDAVQSVKLGGLWWMTDDRYRQLKPLELMYGVVCAIFTTILTNTRRPEQWCDIPDSVMTALPNRVPIPRDQA